MLAEPSEAGADSTNGSATSSSSSGGTSWSTDRGGLALIPGFMLLCDKEALPRSMRSSGLSDSILQTEVSGSVCVLPLLSPLLPPLLLPLLPPLTPPLLFTGAQPGLFEILVVAITVTNLVMSFGLSLGDSSYRLMGSFGCHMQGIVLQFASLSTVLWTVILCYSFHRSAIAGESEDVMKARLPKFMLIAVGAPAASVRTMLLLLLLLLLRLLLVLTSLLQVALLLFQHQLDFKPGQGEQWCWIGGADAHIDAGKWRWWAFYCWVFLGASCSRCSSCCSCSCSCSCCCSSC